MVTKTVSSMHRHSTELHVYNNGIDVILFSSDTQNALTDRFLHVRLVFDWTRHQMAPYFSMLGRDGVETPTVAGAQLELAAEMTAIARIDLFAQLMTDVGAWATFDNIEFFK